MYNKTKLEKQKATAVVIEFKDMVIAAGKEIELASINDAFFLDSITCLFTKIGDGTLSMKARYYSSDQIPVLIGEVVLTSPCVVIPYGNNVSIVAIETGGQDTIAITGAIQYK